MPLKSVRPSSSAQPYRLSPEKRQLRHSKVCTGKSALEISDPEIQSPNAARNQ